MGNECEKGGAAVTCKAELDQLTATVSDLEDGRYRLQWHGTKTGRYVVHVRIDGVPVVHSPVTIRLRPAAQDLAQCTLSGDGLRQAVKGESTAFVIRFADKYGNTTAQTEAFRASFVAGVDFAVAGSAASKSSRSRHPAETRWLDGEAFDRAYEIAYVPAASGGFSLHVWAEIDDGVRVILPGSPFTLSVHANKNDQVVDTTIVAASVGGGVAAGDYTISRGVFDGAQKRWGDFTVDAFASAKTAMVPRFWAADHVLGSEGKDAFAQKWKEGERVWAHPPADLLDALVSHLRSPLRLSEVIVCAPVRANTSWFYDLGKLADEQEKFMAGKLTKVSDDAPARLEEWPIVLFHVPAQRPPR